MENEGGDSTKARTDADEDDDDPPMLSSQALDALKEYLSEQNQSPSGSTGSGITLVAEDWRLSQFWYDTETAEIIAKEVLDLCLSTQSPVAFIACPTLYAYLKVTSVIVIIIFCFLFRLLVCLSSLVWLPRKQRTSKCKWRFELCVF